MEETSVFEKFELQLNQSAKDFLKETAKWAYFLAIMGFIGIGFLLIAAIFAGAIFATVGNTVPGMGALGSSFGAIISILYIALGAIYFFPVYYLFKFATNTKAAFRDNDSEALTNSFSYLKSHYKFIGVTTIVVLGFYVLMLVLAIFGALLGR
jgi:amino acid transporter